MAHGKHFMSVDGWNPDHLNGGEIVVCVIRNRNNNKHYLKVGRVVGSINKFDENGNYMPGVDKDGNQIPNGFYVESLDGKHKYYPSSLAVCLIEEGSNEVKNIIPSVIETEYR